jgi:polysaccharide export outer membrane protein
MKKQILLYSILLLFVSCKSYEKVIYMQQSGTRVSGDSAKSVSIPDPVIKSGDVLIITVNTNTPEAAMPFNLPLIPSGVSSQTYNLGGGANVSYGLSMQNYLVDSEGNLNYPVIGKIKAAGMTKQALVNRIKEEIYPKYIKEEPIILLRYANFRVSVLGEVFRPGTFTIDNEKISILEALALAGDMTIYGNRSQVLLIREKGTGRETVRIDIRDKYLTNSPYFFLQQGDVLYVEPNGPKARSSAIGSAETISISIVSTLISLTTLMVSLLK